jgi:hypothetical protein
MNKLTAVLGLCLLLVAASPQRAPAQTLTYALAADIATPDVLFNTSLGVLTSVSLEFRFQAGVVYDNLLGGDLGTMYPFDVTFFGDAPFYIENTTNSRLTAFSWTLPGHGDGGHTSSYYTASSSGPFIQTYTDQSTLEFFTLHAGDQELSYHPNWTENVLYSPEIIYDDNFNRYDGAASGVHLGDGIVITYGYSVTPVPEPETAIFLGIGALMLLAVFRRRPRRGLRGCP